MSESMKDYIERKEHLFTLKKVEGVDGLMVQVYPPPSWLSVMCIIGYLSTNLKTAMDYVPEGRDPKSQAIYDKLSDLLDVIGEALPEFEQ